MFNFQVELPKAPKSNFDVSHVHRFDARPGNITPCCCLEVIPGDKISIDINSLIKTFPLASPLMGTYKFQYDVFWSPLSNYCTYLRTNAINTKENFNIPSLLITPKTVNHFQELFHYIGCPQDIDYTESDREVEVYALPFLTYWDCFYNYYANQQENQFPITTFNSSGMIVKGMLLDDLYKFLKSAKDYFSVPNNPISISDLIELAELSRPYSEYDLLSLFNKTYLRDYFNARLNTSNMSETTSKVTISGNSFTINQLRLANSIQKYIDRSDLGGTRYGEFIRSCFGIAGPDHLDIPTLLGSVNSYMNFEDVTCTSVGESENTLGQLGGKGYGLLKSNKFHYTAREYGVILINFSITPVVDYYQGLNRFLTKTTWFDLYNPCFDNIGLQPVYKTELALPNSGEDYDDWAATSIGKLPAWSEYKTSYNRVSGELAKSLSYWTNARPVKNSSDQTDFSTYVNPAIWTNSFLDTSPTAKNFLVQAKFNILAKRCMSKNPPRL